MDDGDPHRLRAFVTCSARSVAAVAPLLAEVEHVLQGAGWRTRVPRRFDARDRIGPQDRRRLRLESYSEIERANVLLHVPAPANLAGTRLHREIAHAVRVAVPVLIVAAWAERTRLGLEPPTIERLAWLEEATAAKVVWSLGELPDRVSAVALPRPAGT